MKTSSFTPIVSHSGQLYRFSIKPSVALAWLIAYRQQSADAFLAMLAASPEALTYALFACDSLARPTVNTESQVSAEALVAIVESRPKGSLPNATRIATIEFSANERKAFLKSLKSSTGEAIANERQAKLNRELLSMLEGSELKETKMLLPSAACWQALVKATEHDTKPAFDLDKWLASESEFQERLQQEKMASMKQLAYGASHEINNPLANIASRAQTLMMDEQDPDRKLRLAKINQQAFRAHEMIADMMLYAHPPQPKFAELILDELVQEAIGELQELAEQQRTTLTFNAPKTKVARVIYVDGTQIVVAIRALIQNALESIGEGGRIEVEVNDGQFSCEVTVTDDGPGISDSASRHMFDPFFSGREAGRGLGFGLSKVWRIAELHEGEILAESPPEGGAKFRLRIPYRSPAKSTA